MLHHTVIRHKTQAENIMMPHTVIRHKTLTSGKHNVASHHNLIQNMKPFLISSFYYKYISKSVLCWLPLLSLATQKVRQSPSWYQYTSVGHIQKIVIQGLYNNRHANL
jgi:hypothetical protein